MLRVAVWAKTYGTLFVCFFVIVDTLVITIADAVYTLM